MNDMANFISCWWAGIPGIDGNCIPDDITFADRAAAVVIASRLHGALPLETDHTGPARAAERTEESLFGMFQEAKSDAEALRLRLAVAMIVSTITPGEKHDIAQIERRARALAKLMSRPGRRRERRIPEPSRLAG
jgi:hypothetical protein